MTTKALALALALIIAVAFGFLIGIAKVGVYTVLDQIITGPVTLILIVIFVVFIFWPRPKNDVK